jgi:hypothetical protein
MALVLLGLSALRPVLAEPPADSGSTRTGLPDLSKRTLPSYIGPLPRVRQGAEKSKAAAPPRQQPMSAPTTEAGAVIAKTQAGRVDAPRVELAARLRMAGFEATPEFRLMRENAAREVSGRPDGAGGVSEAELKRADEAIAREVAILKEEAQPPSFAERAKMPGRPQIPGLNIVYLNPLGPLAQSNKWKYIIAHQTEGPAGIARSMALAQHANPTKRGTTIWVETDGTVYWATAEHLIPTQGDGANRNDNKYIDNSKTYKVVVKDNSIGVEFGGNYPDVAKPVTPEQTRIWLILVRFLQERYGIASEHIYAHNWIDYKDHRYCEGCDLGTLARQQAYEPSRTAARN